MKNTILMLFFLIILSVSVFAGGFTVTGKVYFSGSGSVYILLTDSPASDNSESGLRRSVIVPVGEGSEDNWVDFSLSEIPPGTYGISCFQDVNNNGKLDKGFFGPTEPWGMSWVKNRRVPPGFKDYSFYLSGDKEIADIILMK